jgi:phospholipid/cholesterol/gamma-HCH transport system substrate-binding protein
VRNSSAIGRGAAIAALVIAALAITIILLTSSSPYQVKAVFENAGQLVSGDQVEVAGTPIGTVSGISLTPDGEAELTLNINDSHFNPLHQGTTAIIRQASLSGIANRYIQLDLGPANAPKIPPGGMITHDSTTAAVDLDELFNTLNSATRKGLQNVFQGSARQYAGRGNQAQLAWEYLNPAIATSSILFHELNRDTNKFTRFILSTSHLVTDLAAKQSDLSGVVSHLSTTFTALANQHVALGQSIQRLPPFMRLANTTFVNLRRALPDLTNLVNVTRPVAPKLQKLLVQLRPLAIDAVPTVKDLSSIISRPGANNDLIELNHLAPPLAKVTVGHLHVDGKTRRGAFPVSQQALTESIPELAVGRPYAVDLTGWFEGYSHPGVYDANGATSRVAAVVGVGSLSNAISLPSCTSLVQQALAKVGITKCPLGQVLPLLTNAAARLGFAKSVLTTGQGDRCPGSMERGPSPGTSATPVGSGFPCNRKEVPTGP